MNSTYQIFFFIYILVSVKVIYLKKNLFKRKYLRFLILKLTYCIKCFVVTFANINFLVLYFFMQTFLCYCYYTRVKQIFNVGNMGKAMALEKMMAKMQKGRSYSTSTNNMCKFYSSFILP